MFAFSPDVVFQFFFRFFLFFFQMCFSVSQYLMSTQSKICGKSQRHPATHQQGPMIIRRSGKKSGQDLGSRFSAAAGQDVGLHEMVRFPVAYRLQSLILLFCCLCCFLFFLCCSAICVEGSHHIRPVRGWIRKLF